MDPNNSRPGGFHAYSAALLILVDNVFFAGTIATGGLGLFVMCFLAFTLVGAGSFLCQRFLQGEDSGSALAKAFFLGTFAGVPTSVTGTGVGGLLLARLGIRKLLGK
jgi:hypothetical protein